MIVLVWLAALLVLVVCYVVLGFLWGQLVLVPLEWIGERFRMWRYDRRHRRPAHER